MNKTTWKRRLDRGRRAQTHPCPQPEKNAYRTRRDAIEALYHLRRQAFGAVQVQAVYHCECGAYHLTSHPQRDREPSDIVFDLDNKDTG